MKNEKGQVELIFAVITIIIGIMVLAAGIVFALLFQTVGTSQISAGSCDVALGMVPSVEAATDAATNAVTVDDTCGYNAFKWIGLWEGNHGIADCFVRAGGDALTGASRDGIRAGGTASVDRLLEACQPPNTPIEYTCPISSEIKPADEAARCIYKRAVDTYYILRSDYKNKDGDLIPVDLGLKNKDFYKIKVDINEPGAVNLTSVDGVTDPLNPVKDTRGCKDYLKVDYKTTDAICNNFDGTAENTCEETGCKWDDTASDCYSMSKILTTSNAYPYYCDNPNINTLADKNICWKEDAGKCEIQFNIVNEFTMAVSMIENCQETGPTGFGCKCFTTSTKGYSKGNGLGMEKFNPGFYSNTNAFKPGFSNVFADIAKTALYAENSGYVGCGFETPETYPILFGEDPVNGPGASIDNGEIMMPPDTTYVKVGEEKTLYIKLGSSPLGTENTMVSISDVKTPAP